MVPGQDKDLDIGPEVLDQVVAHLVDQRSGRDEVDGGESLLTRGKTVFAVADDDAHSFKPADADAWELTRPGRGWIVVRADTLTPAAILGGIRRGDFYASTGVVIDSLDMNTKEIRLTMKPRIDERFVTEFIGAGGRLLARVTGLRATYHIRGNEGYVRARVTD